MNAFSLAQRNPNFILIWIGQILSQSGARVYQMAIIWWILGHALEDGGTWTGAFMVMTALPSILFVKAIGRMIDKLKSQTILVRADLLSSILIAAVALLLYKDLMALPLALLVGLLGASLQAFIDPTLNKALAEVIAKEDFEKGLSLLASTQSLANFSGAVLGALLIDHLGFSGTALLAGVGYFISSLASQLAKFSYVPSEMKDEQKTGWAILNEYPLIKKLLIGFGLVNFFSTPTLVVLPVYTKKVLMGTATVLGGLEAALWIGLLIGSLISASFLPKQNRILVGAGCIAVFGLALAVPGFIVNPYIYGFALAVAGLALGINNVKFVSLFQESVAPELKGRFFALMQALIGFTFPIAYFLFGALTDIISPMTVCLIQGTGVVLLAFYFLSLVDRRSA